MYARAEKDCYCFSTARVGSRTRHSVTLYVHCLSCCYARRYRGGPASCEMAVISIRNVIMQEHRVFRQKLTSTLLLMIVLILYGNQTSCVVFASFLGLLFLEKVSSIYAEIIQMFFFSVFHPLLCVYLSYLPCVLHALHIYISWNFASCWHFMKNYERESFHCEIFFQSPVTFYLTFRESVVFSTF